MLLITLKLKFLLDSRRLPGGENVASWKGILFRSGTTDGTDDSSCKAVDNWWDCVELAVTVDAVVLVDEVKLVPKNRNRMFSKTSFYGTLFLACQVQYYLKLGYCVLSERTEVEAQEKTHLQ